MIDTLNKAFPSTKKDVEDLKNEMNKNFDLVREQIKSLRSELIGFFIISIGVTVAVITTVGTAIGVIIKFF